ncbi:hypothetical protein N7462_004913 [Penicillium macrosclerotiorum]|uniref:uncharacterized protein n=1 Tax=Penicillium macrosclerotiorum TaxID=303699 RepID=UPI0025475C21|nr:uncharacterized protein N7462_004913 [Penicillium macrosclerotiorum]KAJ5690521.1 hypothetical protein N7462_004913 [Penicillium macrosclerotiorum]
MPPTDAKTKLRPQQSCLKCRERKVKCDRSIPCHACIVRGLEAECTYLTSPEDRAHISQAEIIDRLRREVAQLRDQLGQASRRPSPGARSASDRSAYRRPEYAGSTGSAEHGDAVGGGGQSWSGSSPSSTTTTVAGSLAVTSPGSTGSESGAGSGCLGRGQSPYQASLGYPVSTAAFGGAPMAGPGLGESGSAFGNYMSAGTSFFYHMSSCLVLTGFVSDPIDNATAAQRPADSIPAFVGHMPAPISMHGLPQQPQLSHLYGAGDGMSPGYDGSIVHPYMLDYGNSSLNTDLNMYPNLNLNREDHARIVADHDAAHAYQHPHQQTWGADPAVPMGQHFAAVQQAYPYPDATYYSTSIDTNHHHNNFAPADPSNDSSGPSSHTPPLGPNQTHILNPNHAPLQTEAPLAQTLTAQISKSWKGADKRDLLETILETIGTCDEERVAQVVQVVRTSHTPEEAVSGICHVLGIGSGQPSPT